MPNNTHRHHQHVSLHQSFLNAPKTQQSTAVTTSNHVPSIPIPPLQTTLPAKITRTLLPLRPTHISVTLPVSPRPTKTLGSRDLVTHRSRRALAYAQTEEAALAPRRRPSSSFPSTDFAPAESHRRKCRLMRLYDARADSPRSVFSSLLARPSRDFRSDGDLAARAYPRA